MLSYYSSGLMLMTQLFVGECVFASLESAADVYCIFGHLLTLADGWVFSLPWSEKLTSFRSIS